MLSCMQMVGLIIVAFRWCTFFKAQGRVRNFGRTQLVFVIASTVKIYLLPDMDRLRLLYAADMKKHVLTLIVNIDKAVAFILVPVFDSTALHGRFAY